MKLEMEFISSKAFAEKSMGERVKFILSNVKKNRLIVIDGILKPEEELKLVEETMKHVDDKFSGIEICSLRKELKGYKAVFQKFIDSIPKERILQLIKKLTKKDLKITPDLKDGLTFIGPSSIIKKIKRREDSFKILAEI